MVPSHMQGGALALPTARAFLSVGGQLLLDPDGKLEAKPDVTRCFLNPDAASARRAYVISRRFVRRLRDPRFARSIKALVVTDGEATRNGWLVLAGGQ